MSVKSIDTLRSVVSIRATVPQDGFTASMLGTERSGAGVVINNEGLVLTAGYLTVEAHTVQIETHDGRKVEGHALAYDEETGFGLVQAIGELDIAPIELGDSTRARPGDAVTMFGARASSGASGKIVARQEFTGPWEYLIENAIFTAPGQAAFSGAPLVDENGRLIGIGSLAIQAVGPEGPRDINMSIPVELLKPLLDGVTGGKARAKRPWLGVHSIEQDGRVVVVSVDPRGPGAAAGVEAGDIILDVRDNSIDGLAELYRNVWASGPAGTEIPVRIARDGREQWLRIKTVSRADMLKKPTLQ